MEMNDLMMLILYSTMDSLSVDWRPSSSDAKGANQ